ncbi:hypothetical protein [Mangrovibacterium marinum]|uniref:Uncharacterized protein n=1 Tax=Mangrovibacterium marinum TaxID=1639118 RepID=A0A2T5C175_9BACT|nr:hypothetical protein [Mangrovibacterium marinum]PTN08378.1 hypothetical protein C8N47_109114 [Mangrovibacterium marinum]
MENWYPGFEKKIVDQLKGSNVKDLRFFRIEEYLRNAERTDAQASSCRACYALRNEIEQTADQVAKAVQQPGAERRRIDSLQSRLSDHLRKEHGFYPPSYHTYLQSVYWTVGFMALAFLLTVLFPEVEKAVFYSPAFAIGVITGQVIGGKKDRKVRDSNKIL